MTRFAAGDGYAWYRGPAIEGSLHRHAAFQVAIGIGVGAKMSIVDSLGEHHRGVALVVPPMVGHRMLGGP